MLLKHPLRHPLRYPMSVALGILLGVGFAPQALFGASEPGFHAETYDPDSLLVRRNKLTNTPFAGTVAGSPGTAPTDWTFDGLTGGTTAISGETITQSVAIADRRYIRYAYGAGLSPGTWTMTVEITAVSGVTGDVMLITGTGLTGTTSLSSAAGLGRHSITFTVPGDGGGSMTVRLGVGLGGNTTGAQSVSFKEPQLEKASSASAYQKVTDWNTEYTAAALDRIGMWQDRAGTTPVTAVEQPVGRWMDSKKAMALGAEIITAAADREFSSDTGYWSKAATVSISGGTANWTAAPVAAAMVRSAGNGGRVYEITWTITSISSGGLQTYIGGSLGIIRTAAGTYTERITLGTVDGGLGFQATAAGTNASIDNVSFKEVLGNHATQATAASRPTLSALYNLLTKTEQWTDPYWHNGGAGGITFTNNDTLAPDGTTTAAKATCNTTNSVQYVWPNGGGATVASGFPSGKYVMYIKPSSTTWCLLTMTDGGAVNGKGRWFNLSGAGALGSVHTLGTGVTLVDSAIEAVANGFYKVSVTVSGLSSCSVIFRPVVDADNTLNSTSGHTAWVWHPDLRTSNDWALNQPAYQRVNTATDYDTAGFIHYLKYDGVDDSFQTPAINFSTGDKMTVWAGLTMLTNAGANIACELTANAGATDGGFWLAPPPNASNTIGLATRGTVVNSSVSFSATPPSNVVVVGMLDNAGATSAAQVQARGNGAVQTLAVGTGPTTAGNHANAALNIGRRDNASLPFNGRITSLTVRGTTTPTGTAFIRKMEQYAARLAGQTFTST